MNDGFQIGRVQFGGVSTDEVTSNLAGIATTKIMPPGAIGDINSDAKGSGARYNAGKPPMELIPVSILADFYNAYQHMPARAVGTALAWTHVEVVRALDCIGRFQARDGDDEINLLAALCALGADGWYDCAYVFEYGREKYAEWNWAKGMQWSIPIACATRHLMAMARGEDIDPESGRPHRGHFFCNVVMLYTFLRTYTEGDNRPAKGLI